MSANGQEVRPETSNELNNGIAAVVRRLHAQCSLTLDASLQGENYGRLGECYHFANDLEAWRMAIKGQSDIELLETSASEYVLAMLNVCQGQYRNGFKGLRLVLELSLQSSHLSTNLVLRSEWLKGEQITIWAELVDGENGPLGARVCRAFFPELLDQVRHFRQMAKTLYRELSECTHGNVPNHIPLPGGMGFSQETFELWHSKANLVRHIVQFALALRYLRGLCADRRAPLEAALTEQLGHIAAIRSVFGGGDRHE